MFIIICYSYNIIAVMGVIKLADLDGSYHWSGSGPSNPCCCEDILQVSIFYKMLCKLIF